MLVAPETAFAAVDQEYLFLARQLQALSFGVHIPLVCFGISFPAMVLFAEWRWLCTGDPLYRTIAKRWSKVMLALFAVGVVTGTILSFELGMLWPGFMAAFGDVFGLGFALEGFSFFLEAIFIAIYVYGWDRLSPRLHFLSGIPIFIAGFTGSLFVIAVNSWMNHPGGFVLRNGRAADVEPWSALFGNPFLWHEHVHMYVAGFIVAGFLVGGVYAWDYLKDGARWGRYQRAALTIALFTASVAAPLQIVIGDWAARTVARQQPVKLAAMEGLGQTTSGASLHLLGWYDGKTVKYGIALPRMLSLLAFHDPNATVQGLDAVPSTARPPVNVVRIAFQTMLGCVFLYARLRRKRLPTSRWFYRALVAAGPLSVIALIAGWITTEVGRQPWIVYETMRVSEAVTGARGIPIGYGTLVVVYAGLAAAVWWMLRRFSRVPLPSDLGSPP